MHCDAFAVLFGVKEKKAQSKRTLRVKEKSNGDTKFLAYK